ncbi:MAG: plasmid partitioning protein, partial [Mesorhizobium sp.]
AGQNVTVASGTRDISYYGAASLGEHASRLFNAEGALEFDMDTLRVAVRSLLIDVLSCRENKSNSGIVARVAGDAIGADNFLANMGTDEFLSCLSRPALEGSCKDTPVLPRQKVKDTRAALVEHFREGRFVHPAALFAPDKARLSSWLTSNAASGEDEPDDQVEDPEAGDDVGGAELTDEEPFREAAE